MRKLVCALLVLWLIAGGAGAQMLGAGISMSEGRGKGSGKGTGTGITISGISLSGTTFNAGDPSGTVVGAISVQTSGGAFSGTISGPGGADAASFTISSASLPSNLKTSGNACPVGPCTFNITLTVAQGGATCGIPACTQAFVITVGGAPACNNRLDFSQACNSGLLGMTL